jgi:hypothetical protein
MLGDLGIDEIVAGGLESGKGAGRVLAHEVAVTDRGGARNGSPPEFHCVSPSTLRQAVEGSSARAGFASDSRGSFRCVDDFAGAKAGQLASLPNHSPLALPGGRL